MFIWLFTFVWFLFDTIIHVISRFGSLLKLDNLRELSEWNECFSVNKMKTEVEIVIKILIVNCSCKALFTTAIA